MTLAALGVLGENKTPDEELVAVVENNACGVDALQYLSGCTFGKGNLVFKDYGKHVYTIYERASKKGVRVLFKAQDLPQELDREKLVKWILSAPQEQVVKIEMVDIEEPEPARIMKSVICELCGEAVMETRIVEVEGKKVCIPCAEKREKVN